MKQAIPAATFLAIALAVSWPASATQPCDGNDCIDGASAALIASVDALTEACSLAHPEDAESYKAALASALGPDASVVAQVRAMPGYSSAAQEAKARIANMPAALLGDQCSALAHAHAGSH